MTIPKTPIYGLNKIDRSSPTTTTYNLQTYHDDVMDTLDTALGLKTGNADVRVATTANITLSGIQTIDGVAVIVGDRVLVKNQTAGSENGIYIVASGVWVRAADADISAKLASGLSMYVKEGTANQKTEWRMSNVGTVTLGTTALTFQQTGFNYVPLNKAGDTVTNLLLTADPAVALGAVTKQYADSISTNLRSDGTKALVAEVRTTDPISPVIGQIWFRSDL
jgi:phage-related tail fiber protein